MQLCLVSAFNCVSCLSCRLRDAFCLHSSCTRCDISRAQNAKRPKARDSGSWRRMRTSSGFFQDTLAAYNGRERDVEKLTSSRATNVRVSGVNKRFQAGSFSWTRAKRQALESQIILQSVSKIFTKTHIKIKINKYNSIITQKKYDLS